MPVLLQLFYHLLLSVTVEETFKVTLDEQRASEAKVLHLVKKAKHVVSIYQVCNHMHWRPASCLEKSLAKLGEGNIVHGENLSDVAFPTSQQEQ